MVHWATFQNFRFTFQNVNSVVEAAPSDMGNHGLLFEPAVDKLSMKLAADEASEVL